MPTRTIMKKMMRWKYDGRADYTAYIELMFGGLYCTRVSEPVDVNNVLYLYDRFALPINSQHWIPVAQWVGASLHNYTRAFG